MIYKISGGDVIKAAMRAKGKSVRDAAKEFDINERNVVKHRNSDSDVMLSTIQKYAAWLDLELSEMFAFAEAEKLLAKGF